LGGLDQDVDTKNFTKVPFLGDLPGVGYLFRSDTKTHSKQTILIFVTPTIVQDQDFQPAEKGFLKRKQQWPAEIAEPPWDTGAPYDWTKPDNNGIGPDYKP
jgi:type II secretory pathway component GspD/PulD (secretin)